MDIATQGTEYAAGARFTWVPFYEALARALLVYQQDRAPLVQAVLNIGVPESKLDYLTHDQFADGRVGPLEDIDPFTALAVFNRSSGYTRRTEIAAELARFLHVKLPPPTDFAGIPTVDPRSSWYFGFAKDRGAEDIDVLWQVFVAAAQLDTIDDAASRAKFIAAYDAAITVSGVKWNLSFGLFWSHPHRFLPMSSKAQRYFRSTLGKPLGTQPPDGRAYLALIDELREMFRRPDAPVHGFPDLALAAWLAERSSAAEAEAPSSQSVADAPSEPAQSAAAPYTIDDIVVDGCFLERAEIDKALARLKARKNLILQGPPGTGKTWLARRLAYACVGAKDDTCVEVVQFHANSSYEDLVCGYRPDGHGKLAIADGPILRAVSRARESPDQRFVVVIEEFNRGNPAHILGELLTLLEASQRSIEHALRLAYPDSNGCPRSLFIPENFYLIGTMNVADRSLATLDHALRRRFAFVELRPAMNEHWAGWLKDHGVDRKFAEAARARVKELNSRIAEDALRLGPQYVVGHSYVTPHEYVAEPAEWFRAVVETEIGPLLDDYWFDEPAIAKEAREQLLKDWPPT